MKDDGKDELPRLRKKQTVLDEMQKKAVIEAAENGLFILTGGPGTGKTTTINAIIRFFEGEGSRDPSCCAYRKGCQSV